MDLKSCKLILSEVVRSRRNLLKGVKLLQIRNVVCLLATSTVVYYLLHLAVWCGFKNLLNIAVAVLAIHIAANLIHYGWEYLFRSTMPDVDSKAVLITGCDTGFGNKLARQLDAKGVTVFAGCLFSDSSNALQLKKECSDKLHIVQLDVTSDQQVKAALDTVTKVLDGKKLWSVINNAGIAIMAETEVSSLECYRRTLEVNTLGVARVTKAFLPLLRQSRGRVVIVTSVASYLSFPGGSSYCMSKAAVFKYSELLRAEMMRWDVSVHTVEPWLYRTEIANLEVVTGNMKKEFNLASEEVRLTYGGDGYLKAFEFVYKFLMGIMARPGSCIHEVVDCLEDAVIGIHPQQRYTPGFLGKLFAHIFTFIPRDLVDLLQHMVVPYKGIYEEESKDK